MKKSFNRSQKLTGKKEINEIIRIGKRVKGNCLIIYFLPSDMLRMGLSVRKGISSSVRRNLLKRRLREILRVEQEKLKPVKLFLISSADADNLNFTQLKWEITNLLNKADLYHC